MSRGFNVTVGVGTTDLVTTKYSKTQQANISGCLWVYKNSGGSAMVAMHQLSSGNSGWGLQSIGNTSERLITSTSGASHNLGFTGKGLNVWQHWGFSYDGTTAIAYVNGVNVASAVQAMTTNTLTVLIGALGSNSQTWNGFLAEATYWNGALLGATEFAEIYNGASPLSIMPAAMALYLPLDGVNNPEPDYINGCTSAMVGTALGTSNPGASSIRALDAGFDELTAAAALAAKFRKTLSGNGNHVGGRQAQGWG